MEPLPIFWIFVGVFPCIFYNIGPKSHVVLFMDCYPSFTVLAHRCFLTHAVWRNHRGSTPFKEQKLQRISWQPSPAVVGVRVFVVLGVTIPHAPNVWNIMKYLPTFGWKNYGTCIGKYSSAMDHMGIAKTHYILGVFRKPVRRTLYILSQTAKNWNFFLKTSFVTIQLLWKVVFCCFWIKKKFWKLSKTLFLQTKSFWECFFTNWKKMFKSC